MVRSTAKCSYYICARNARNVDPIQFSEELDRTLHDYIDPSALETLVGNDQAVEITFRMDEYTIQIDNDGLIVGHD